MEETKRDHITASATGGGTKERNSPQRVEEIFRHFDRKLADLLAAALEAYRREKAS